MKSLKSICENNIAHSLHEVLANIDEQNDAHDNSIPARIERWIEENYEYSGLLKISKKPNKNGLYEVTAHEVKVKNRKITSLTNEMFEWKEIKGDFSCYKCTSLKSLEGAPKKVGYSFDCCECINLRSLVGAPEKVEGNFNCARCTSLKTLDGAPKVVGEDFYCYDCKSLDSIVGAPQKVEGDFHCHDCKIEFTEDEVKKVCDVKGIIYYY